MSNFWNKDGLVVDVIKTSNGVKFITEDDVKSGVGHAVGWNKVAKCIIM